jgi:hypothetical protein
LLMLYPI